MEGQSSFYGGSLRDARVQRYSSLFCSVFCFLSCTQSLRACLYVPLLDLSGKGIGKALMSKVAQVSMHTFPHSTLPFAQRIGMPRLPHCPISTCLVRYSVNQWKCMNAIKYDILLCFAVLQLGLAAGCSLMDFTVLDWNKSSVDFYLSQGCHDVTNTMGYHLMRCEGEALQKLAQP